MYNNSSLPKPMTRREFLTRSLALGALIGLGGDAIAFEPRYPVLTSYDVALPNLPGELDGFRIVQLSDIHRRRITPDSVIRRAVELANSTNADVAALTGDFVGKDLDDIDPCFEMLSELRTRLGSYAILGNHDHWLDADVVSRSIVSHGITLLNNANAKIAENLYFVGIDDEWAGEPDVETAMLGLEEKVCCVMLSHIPEAIDLFEGHSGLVLSGHTHGGQVKLPSLRWVPDANPTRYVEGWYRKDRMLMYVSRGVGMSILPLRFRCRPEVTLFVLHPSQKDSPTLMRTIG